MSRILVVVPLLACLLPAQPAEPSSELAKFERLLGNWTGNGTFSEPDGSEGKWTARCTVKKTLGDHIVQEDMQIELEGMDPPLVFRTLYYWDAPTKAFRYMSFGNTSELDGGVIYWLGNDQLVGASTAVEDGQPVTRRWVYNLKDKDGLDFRIDGARGAGDFATQVRGSYKRGGEGFDPLTTDVKPFMGEPGPEMAKVRGQIGKWSFKGSMSPTPGAPRMDIAGTETVRPFLGGHINYSEMKSEATEDMPAFEGQWCMGWDPSQRCYVGLMLDNMGTAQTEKVYALSDRKFVGLIEGVLMGIPTVQRTIIDIAADGNSVKVVADRCAKDLPPERCFEGTMTRIAGAEGEVPASDRGDRQPPEKGK